MPVHLEPVQIDVALGQLAAFGVLSVPAPVTAVAAVAVAALLIGAAVGLLLGRRHGRAECDGLEARLAERTHERDESRQRFDLMLANPAITAFAQDRSLALTWVHNLRPGLAAGNGGAGADPDASPATELQRRALATGMSVTDRVTVVGDAGVLHFDMTASPIRAPDGRISGVLSTAIDVTEQRKGELRLAAMAAQLSEAYRRFELALDTLPITVFEQDTDLRFTFLYNPPPGTRAEDFIGRTDETVFSEADRRLLVPAKRRVLAARASETLEMDVTLSGIPRFYELHLEPRLDSDGVATGVIGTALDLTERRRAEERMRSVMRELTHRSKNLLAVIQSMARKTASLAPDVDTFVTDFSARLRAMAASHDLLVEEAWSGAEIGALLAANLAPSIDPRGSQVSMAGPRLKLDPDAAQTLGLAFHELTVNAVRHGALSVAEGRVRVDWDRVDGHVAVHWREQGGPAVDAPARRGFGRLLLERLTGASLGGEVRLDFPAEGVACAIRFPADRLAES